jgi:hypothetical protein
MAKVVRRVRVRHWPWVPTATAWPGAATDFAVGNRSLERVRSHGLNLFLNNTRRWWLHIFHSAQLQSTARITKSWQAEFCKIEIPTMSSATTKAAEEDEEEEECCGCGRSATPYFGTASTGYGAARANPFGYAGCDAFCRACAVTCTTP